jgi:glycosyltransferase involved in cell wall biosynthesis
MNVLLCERINPANQYIDLLASAYQNAGHPIILGVQNFLFSDCVPDILHVHWPEAIYSWRFKLPATSASVARIEARLRWYRSRGCCIVHTVHNLKPHTTLLDAFERDVYSSVLRHSDILVHHGHASIQLVEQEYGRTTCAGKAIIVAPHGPYPAQPHDPALARRRYGLPSGRTVFLSFGRQRPNKGPDFVRRCFANTPNASTHLFVIGPRLRTGSNKVTRILNRVSAPLAGRARPFMKRWSNSTVINREVAHEEIPFIIASADALFLGHQTGLNSGILALAASYGKPVVYPNIGNFAEQVEHWPWAVSYRPGDTQSARAAIRVLLDRLSAARPPVLDNTEWLARNSWDLHVQTVIDSVDEWRTLNR